MKVAKDLVVSLAYQVRTEDGVLVDESPVSAPLDYLHGHGSLISAWKRRWKVMKLATNLMSLLARTTLTVSTTKTWCNVFLKTYLWALMNCR